MYKTKIFLFKPFLKTESLSFFYFLSSLTDCEKTLTSVISFGLKINNLYHFLIDMFNLYKLINLILYKN